MSTTSTAPFAGISQQTAQAHIALSRTIAGEGMVLLKNDNGALPLKKGEQVAVFGGVGKRFYKGGEGSGNVQAAYVRDLLQGMQLKAEEGKVVVHAALADSYTADNDYAPTAQTVREAAAISNTAIVTIARNSSEGGDTCAEKGDYYLSDAEVALLENVSAAGFKSVVVVLNVGRVIDTAWIEQYPCIDAVLLAWQAGQEGGLAAADILVGDVNPSGKLTDTFAKAYSDYATSDGFKCFFEYADYTEDIYVGYRWFETFDPNYEKVNFEFGFGLSYTEFELSGVKVSNDGDNMIVSVDVKNIGSCAGKEVVQVYYSAPQGVLGKPAKALAGFVKTGLLEVGAQETVVVIFPLARMASYDDTGKLQKSAYILEKGDYKIYVGNSIKDAGARGVQGVYTLDADTVTEQLTPRAIPYQLDYRLQSDGTYEILDTYKEMTEPDAAFTQLAPEAVTRIEAEDCWYKQRYARAQFNADATACALCQSPDGEDSRMPFVEFAVDAKQAGVYDLRLAWGIQTTVKNAVSVYVDGIQQSTSMLDLTETGDVWNIREFGPLKVQLDAGKSLLRVVFNVKDGIDGLFDYITLALPEVDYATPAAKLVATPDPAKKDGEKLSFREVCKNPEQMDAFIDQLTYEDFGVLLCGAGNQNPNLTAAQGSIGHMEEYDIPYLEVCDGPAGVDWGGDATAWPIGTAVACTWNPELIEQMGEGIAKEAVEVGVDLMLTPGIDIHRNPLCGRNFEYMSEDPLVSGLMSAALVRGLEGAGVACSLKHFVANERETSRVYMDSRVSERALREIYLKAFQIALENSNPSFIMSSYNRVNGSYTSESHDLLTEILRGEWGYEGMVITDWWNSGNQPKEIAAGNDVKMQSGYPEEVVGALKSGRLSREAAACSARRTLTAVLNSGAARRMMGE